MSRVLSTEAAAELLGVEVSTVRKWLRRGRIPGRRVGKLWRIPEQALIEWLRGPELREAPAPVSTPESRDRAALVRATLGKYAGVLASSEAFNREKQAEIARENRRWKKPPQAS